MSPLDKYSFINSFYRKILNILFPCRCVDCRKEGFWICPKCLVKVASAEKPADDWIYSVWSYKDGRIRRLLWLFKWSGRHDVINDLSDTLYDHFLDEFAERRVFENLDNPILVPIPISRKKFRRRGYNQAKIIATKLAEKSTGLMVASEILKKVKDGPDQNSIKNKRERFENIRGAFKIRDGELVRGRNVILIDDILTTGATLSEARRTLKSAGAKNIFAFTVAH